MQSPDLGYVDNVLVDWQERFDLVGQVDAADRVFARLCGMGLILVIGSIGQPGLAPRILASRRVLRLEPTNEEAGEAFDPVDRSVIYDLQALPAAYAAQDVPEAGDYPGNGHRFESALMALQAERHRDFVYAYEKFMRRCAKGEGTEALNDLVRSWLFLVDGFCAEIDAETIVMVARPNLRDAKPKKFPPPFDRGWWREGDTIRMDDGQTLYDVRFHDYEDVEAWEAPPAPEAPPVGAARLVSGTAAEREAEILRADALLGARNPKDWPGLPIKAKRPAIMEELGLDPGKKVHGYGEETIRKALKKAGR